MYLRSTGTASSAPISSTLYVSEWLPRLSVTCPCARVLSTQFAGPIPGDQPAVAADLDRVHRRRVRSSGLPPPRERPMDSRLTGLQVPPQLHSHRAFLRRERPSRAQPASRR